MIKKGIVFCVLVFGFFVHALADNKCVVLKKVTSDNVWYISLTCTKDVRLVSLRAKATEFIMTDDICFLKWIDGQLWYLAIDADSALVLSQDRFSFEGIHLFGDTLHFPLLGHYFDIEFSEKRCFRDDFRGCDDSEEELEWRKQKSLLY